MIVAKRITERRLVDVLMQHVRQDHAAAREVPHYEKRIDVALVSCDTQELWAIEAKTSHWMRALSQAIVNLSAADRSYIAIYSKHAGRVDMSLLAEYGIGLIAVGTRWGDVEILKDAERSPCSNGLVVERLKSQIPNGVG